jgi:dihydroxyacetone kinase DhaK subunit
MKKIINDPKNVVPEMLEGMEMAFPHLVSWNRSHNVVMRKNLDPGKVTIIAGGGSGHEPFQGGFVGEGMLDAAVCGNIFASPSPAQVYNAILDTRSSRGTLLLIVNYTGDRMCFDNAAEMAIEDEGIEVEKVYVNDDVAIADPKDRRGIAGAVLIDKVAGAAAESGATLRDVKEVTERGIANLRSIGLSLTSCVLPEKGGPIFQIGDNEMEFGMGVHGEQGVKRIEMVSAEEMARMMMDKLLPDLPYRSGDEVVMLVNGLGATPLQELFIMNREVRRILAHEKISVYKTLVGNYMSSLDMAGLSVSLMKLDGELKKLIDAPVATPALKTF